jgi:hypothetical protein
MLELQKHLGHAAEHDRAGHADHNHRGQGRRFLVGFALLLGARVSTDLANLPPGDAAATGVAAGLSGGQAGTNCGELAQDCRQDEGQFQDSLFHRLSPPGDALSRKNRAFARRPPRPAEPADTSRSNHRSGPGIRSP